MQVSYIVVEYSNESDFQTDTAVLLKIELHNRGHKESMRTNSSYTKHCTHVYMLRPNSQPLTGFESGRPASNPSTRFEAGARVVSASLARRLIEQYYHAPFLHVLNRSVSCERSLACYGVLLAASHSTRERIVSRLDFDTRLQ